MNKTLIATDAISLKHLTGWGHPESPARYSAISHALGISGLNNLENILKPRAATTEELLLCHTPDYLETVNDDFKKVEALGILDGQYCLSTGDVQICPASLEVALMAVGSVLVAVDAVMEGKADNVFSLMRPPGHHACRNRGMGFCLFNNIAIGARYAQKKYGIKKILIVDWDVHHGNGTQDIFDDDPSIFYFSTHQELIYPGTGAAEDQGLGAAEGTKMNFPIAPGASSREEVLKAFRGPLLAAMKSFKPEFIMISAGFDAHHADPLGGFNLTEEDFGELTRIVLGLADDYAEGRLVSVLEGGYNLEALAASAVAHVKALNKKS